MSCSNVNHLSFAVIIVQEVAFTCCRCIPASCRMSFRRTHLVCSLVELAWDQGAKVRFNSFIKHTDDTTMGHSRTADRRDRLADTRRSTNTRRLRGRSCGGATAAVQIRRCSPEHTLNMYSKASWGQPETHGWSGSTQNGCQTCPCRSGGGGGWEWG